MKILGVESTAHTFGVGIITDKGKILANIRDMFNTEEGGMIPNKVAEHHQQVAEKVLQKAFSEAKIDWKEIDLIAYSAGPGIDPVLWTGYHIVKKWAEEHQKKIVGVNHCCAHLSIGKKINELKDPAYIYVSGVNTQVIVYEGGHYRVVGETLDIGLGNLLDKFARIIGLGFPGGPKIEQLALTGKYIELPYTVKGMDVSFSGIFTKVQQLWKKKPTWNELLKKQGKTVETPFIHPEEKSTIKIIERFKEHLNQPLMKEDLCFSIQETCFAMLTEVTERALANTGKKELLLVGGVGANKRFCEMLQIMCKERGARFFKCPIEFVVDNGAMIAWEGYLRRKESGDIEVNPQWRTDEV